MRRKERIRRIGVVLLFVGTLALGGMVGVFIFVTNPDLLPGPATEAPATQVVGPTLTPEPDWDVVFEYRFTGTEWSTGSHRYQLRVQCPQSGSASWSGSVSVSNSAELRFERVYLRTQGVYDQARGGNLVGDVHPNQTLGASLTLSYPTVEQADASRADCSAHVRLDGGEWERMEPRIPTQDE